MEPRVASVQPLGHQAISLIRHQQRGAMPSQRPFNGALPRSMRLQDIDQLANEDNLSRVKRQALYQLVAKLLI
ncbi:hypothetical protein D3C86_2177340 [compost metagenome]